MGSDKKAVPCPPLPNGDSPSSTPYCYKHAVWVPKTRSIYGFLRSLDSDSLGPAGFVVGVQLRLVKKSSVSLKNCM